MLVMNKFWVFGFDGIGLSKKEFKSYQNFQIIFESNCQINL